MSDELENLLEVPDGTQTGEPQPQEGEGPQQEESPQAQPQKILGKFATVEDLIRSYQELEREFHRMRQAQSQQPREEPVESGERVEQEEVAYQPDEFFARFAERPVETVQSYLEPVVWDVATQVAQQAVMAYAAWQDLLRRYPDAAQYEQVMVEYQDLVPAWLARGKTLSQVVEDLYKLAKATASGVQNDSQIRQQVRDAILRTTVEAGGPGAVAAPAPPGQKEVIDILEAAGGKPALRPA